MSPENMLTAAERFMWLNARLIDRLRFEYHFKAGRSEPVRQALLAYRTDDGGFGHSLEPDTRGPVAQPLAVWAGLDLLHEVGLSGDAVGKEIIGECIEWLKPVTASDGGIPFVLPSIADVPHAPWLVPEAKSAGSLLMTGLLVSTLRKLNAQSPWLESATEFCWSAMERMTRPHPYEARSALALLDSLPESARRKQAFERVRNVVRDQQLVTLKVDPDSHEETHRPLDFAPNPDGMARQLFDAPTIESELDAMVSGQQRDGGWQIDWTVWTPIVEPEWRGVQTIRRLLTLRAYGRLPSRARS